VTSEQNAEHEDDVLVSDLRALGRSVEALGPESAGPRIAAVVLARLASAPAPRPAGRGQRLRAWIAEAVARHRRRVLVVLAVIVLGCLGVPGVRAAVLDWFTFDGVHVRIQPRPGPSRTEAPPPPTAHGTSLGQARSQVAFRPVVLKALGSPQGVEVSTDRRVLSLTWNGPAGATTRLDEFDGTLDYVFAKTSPEVEWTTVGSTTALWFDQPHEVVIRGADGQSRTETARLAGHTLIWEQDGTALRLEGDFTRRQAVELAESAELLR
jgi:hypothetical protein